MSEVELPAGTIEYDDSGGDGPVLVFLHGAAMNGSVWAPVIADLRRDHRCVVPTLPLAFGWLTKRGDADTARWMKPVMERPEIRRDTLRTLRAAAANTHLLVDAAECLPHFQHPALIVWASGDRVMPPEHGRRLAELLPHGHLTQIDDSYTLIPLDQPTKLAQAIREFTKTPSTTQAKRT